jgi:hypothetical protein
VAPNPASVYAIQVGAKRQTITFESGQQIAIMGFDMFGYIPAYYEEWAYYRRAHCKSEPQYSWIILKRNKHGRYKLYPRRGIWKILFGLGWGEVLWTDKISFVTGLPDWYKK